MCGVSGETERSSSASKMRSSRSSREGLAHDAARNESKEGGRRGGGRCGWLVGGEGDGWRGMDGGGGGRERAARIWLVKSMQ
jgi:hypothetical protein